MAPRSFNSLYILLELYALNKWQDIANIRKGNDLLVHSYDWCKETRVTRDKVRKDELEPEREWNWFFLTVRITDTDTDTLTAYLVWLHLVRR